MVLLDSNTTERYLRHIVRISSLAADLGVGVLGEIKEDLAVKHTVLIQVKNLGSATGFGLLNLPLLLSFSRLLRLLLSKLVLKRPGHLFHFLLVFAHLLFKISFHLGLGLSIHAASAHAAATSLKLCLELGILSLQLTDQLGLGVFVDRGLVLNLLGTIGVSEGG